MEWPVRVWERSRNGRLVSRAATPTDALRRRFVDIAVAAGWRNVPDSVWERIRPGLNGGSEG